MLDTPDAMNPLQTSIPMDVLCVIFDMLRSPEHHDESPPKFDSSWPLQWVHQVTHVCRSWREAALSVSFLWTHIHIDASVSWAIEFARRSGNAPIHIYLNGFIGFGPGVFECMKGLLQENRHRIQGMFLEDIHEYDEELLILALSVTVDDGPLILDDLKISLHDKSWDDSDRDDIYNYTFLLPLNDIFDAPKLKRLSLEYCAIAEESGPFHNLSHLSLRETPESNFAAPLLCRALLDMPNIETLDLTLEYFGHLNSPNFGSQLVTLPKLYHINIYAWPIQWIVPLFQMISSRPQRTVWVTGVEVDRFEQIFQVFTCILSHAIENPASSMHRLTLMFDLEELCVRASHGNRILDDDIRYSVDWSADRLESGFGLTRSLLDGLLRRINHQDLRILVLSSSNPLPARVWVEYFGKLPSLTSISIASPGEPQFFTALIDGSEDAPVETNVSVVLPFPALMEVRIAVDDRREVFTDTDMECMLKCLRTRMDLGLELKALSFMMGCSNRLDLVSQVNAFRGVVTKVEVSRELLEFYCPAT